LASVTAELGGGEDAGNWVFAEMHENIVVGIGIAGKGAVEWV
jgi:hypothetical protein